MHSHFHPYRGKGSSPCLRSGGPGQAPRHQQERVKFWHSEGRVSKGRHHSRRTMTVLTYEKPLLALASRAPCCSNFVPPRIRCEGFRHKLDHVRLLRWRQPIPAAQQWNDVASEAVNGPEKAVFRTIKILGSKVGLAVCPPGRP